MTDEVRLTRDPIDLAALHAASPEDGAVVVFVGVVRGRNRGREVVRLEYEAYEEMALPLMQEVVAEVRGRFGVTHVRLVHRVGVLAVGEVSVAIAVSAPHRSAAFDACRCVVKALKARVPIWKRETYTDGAAWLDEPRP
jgi:molybdopterin synthase catalytic subunit